MPKTSWPTRFSTISDLQANERSCLTKSSGKKLRKALISDLHKHAHACTGIPVYTCVLTYMYPHAENKQK